ncbi:MAG: radical SAM protein [Thermoprotei archaeon]|nr:radical SAM protein [Thermoprotei archaeon]
MVGRFSDFKGGFPCCLQLKGSFYGRPVYQVVDPLPLVGHIAFGVIDRGTNIIQVRPTTICQHSCIFCSVDAGPRSVTRASEFIVEPRWLVRWTVEVARFKGGGVEALLDGVGEPLSHPDVLSLIRGLKSSGYIARVAVETHGGFLSRRLALELEKAGLDRINLSVDALDAGLARTLVGVGWYDVGRVLDTAAWIIENTSIDVVLTPVLVPGFNEAEMKALVEWARRHGAGRKSGWPTGVLIQKYEVHKYGRKVRGVREWGWSRFYSWLRGLERDTGYRLIVEPEELGFEKRPSLEKPYRVGDKVKVVVVGPGWHWGETLAMDVGQYRVIAVMGDKDLRPSQKLSVVIVRDADNIYVANV